MDPENQWLLTTLYKETDVSIHIVLWRKDPVEERSATRENAWDRCRNNSLASWLNDGIFVKYFCCVRHTPYTISKGEGGFLLGLLFPSLSLMCSSWNESFTFPIPLNGVLTRKALQFILELSPLIRTLCYILDTSAEADLLLRVHWYFWVSNLSGIVAKSSIIRIIWRGGQDEESSEKCCTIVFVVSKLSPAKLLNLTLFFSLSPSALSRYRFCPTFLLRHA